MDRDDRSENGDDDRQGGRADERTERDGAERELQPVVFRARRSEVRRGTGPRKDEGREREVLLALHQEADGGRRDEDRLPELVAIRDVDPRADTGGHRDERGREDDREMRAPAAIAEDDGRMDEQRCGEPAEMTVHVLGETQEIQRQDDTL